MNYFDNRSTNASAESFNAKVKAFRNQFRGVRDISFFIFRLNASAESFNAKVKAFRNQFRGVRDISFFIFRLAKIFA